MDRVLTSGRPAYHFVAPRGWMNDPCAPGYDQSTGLYHLFYQWNPESHVWGSISWGHTTSRDLIHWDHQSEEPVFRPDQTYDKEGIFTGCFYPSGPQGEEGLSVVYTSVNHLPIAWDQPYKRGCEGLSLASSTDGGQTWSKYSLNPILPAEPPNLDVTGFRDPFIAKWESMDELRGTKSIYGLVSGGIRHVGPQTFLYAISPTDLTKWTYLHPLIDNVPLNYTSSSKWGGDFGINWECTNFITLTGPGGMKRELVITGTEGGKEREHVTKETPLRPQAARRIPRYANWFFGSLRRKGDEVRMNIGTNGLLDWGIFYAASSFVSSDGRNVVWGWLIEEDLPKQALAVKGWTGCLGIPREVYLQVHSDVIGTVASKLGDIGSMEITAEGGRSRVVTLGVRPIAELDRLRCTRLFDHPGGPSRGTENIIQQAPSACEIHCVVYISHETESVSLDVRSNIDKSIKTSIIFRPQAETISVDRKKSTTRDNVNTSTEVASHTLLISRESGQDLEHAEPLDLRVFLDYDIIEIFANERFALATRVYSPADCTGISITTNGRSLIESVRVWELENINS